MHTLPLNFFIFQSCGIWKPLTWSSDWKYAIYKCYTFVMLTSLYSLALSQFIDLVFAPKTVEEFTHSSYMFLATLAASGKSAILIIKRDKIIDLMNLLRNDSCKPRNEDEIKMRAKSDRDTRSNTVRYSTFTATSVSLVILRSLAEDLPHHMLPFNAYIPFNLQTSPIGYWFVYFHQLIGLATGAVINSAFDTLVPGLMMHTFGQMKILKYRIENLPRNIKEKRMSSEDNGEECQSLESELLTDRIKHHVQILRIAEYLNTIFGEVVLFQFIISSLVLCMSVYEMSAMNLVSAEFTATIGFLFCMVIQIFIYCFYADEMSIQSVDISNTIYRMDWLLLSKATKKGLVTIMIRSQRPVTFTCGRVITVSLESFGNLIKTSYSVYNVLQQSSM